MSVGPVAPIAGDPIEEMHLEPHKMGLGFIGVFDHSNVNGDTCEGGM